jgi:hypothetical protein
MVFGYFERQAENSGLFRDVAKCQDGTADENVQRSSVNTAVL